MGDVELDVVDFLLNGSIHFDSNASNDDDIP